MKKQPKRQKTPTVFTQNFTKVLRERGISIKMASDLMELPYSTVADWAAGTSPNNLEAIGKFCRKLGISFSWLVIGVDERSDSNLADIPIDALFEEQDAGFDGIYRLKATRLLRKKISRETEET